MQKADTVLSILREKSLVRQNYTFHRLYRNLFNHEFFLKAYNEIYNKEGNLTPGTDGKTIDGFGYELMEKLVNSLKDESYKPNPVRRTYIPKKNGKMRPLGIPSFQDKLVQAVIKQILEAIYEPQFLNSSHGFRENRSCHTALYQIKNRCIGANWFIEGDIKGFFDNMNQEILINLLEKKLKDGRFIGLIRKFLKAGYLEFNQVHSSLTGTPQGGIISPILSNIYLHELDKYMGEIENEYNSKHKRLENRDYRRLVNLRAYYKSKKNWTKVKELTKKINKTPVFDPIDENYCKVAYIRYCDDFIISVIGSKNTAKEIRDRVKHFLKENLDLELNIEKTLITHAVNEKATFLGYEIKKAVNNEKLTKNKNGFKTRAINGKIQLFVPWGTINKKLKPFRKNNKSVHCNDRVHLPIREIINMYNAEIRGLYNYYCLAVDVGKKLSKFKFFHYFSMAKTIAKKEKSSVKKVIAKYAITVDRKSGGGTRNIIGIKYNSGKTLKTLTYFNDSLKRVNKPVKQITDTIRSKRHEIINRLNAKTCELCGVSSEDSKDFVVHHVRRLKDVLEKYKTPDFLPPLWILVMEGMRRKTLVVCKNVTIKFMINKSKNP